VREKIEAEWVNISNAIRDVLDFVRGKTFIRCDKALPSYLVLIPLVHVRYHFEDEWKLARDVDSYLLRSSLSGSFSGTPDQMIDDLVRRLNEIKKFDLDEVLGVIRSKGRSLELTEGRFWEMGYGSDTIHLLFNLWYREFNYTPAYDNNLPQVDHIFPQSLLRKMKVANPTTGKLNIMKYREADRNQLGNCMLLTAAENGAGGKRDKPPEKWFAGKTDDYLDMHLIPKDPSLWKLEAFEKFIEARKELIRDKFASLLVAAPGNTGPP
jgi:hypothetical protein